MKKAIALFIFFISTGCQTDGASCFIGSCKIHPKTCMNMELCEERLGIQDAGQK